ncbi:MAG: dihydrofolate reductase family protein, partial [Actinomycetota bacterium]|nr:dihydrofolate reductase family protein [Actinomycetota bacterium]
SVLVEGGPTLGWSAIEAGVVDRVVLYLAPVLLGGTGAPGILGGRGIATLADAARARIEDVTMIGDDVKVVARVHRDR